jgi:nucleoside-diphosphate-sugar epimerase
MKRVLVTGGTGFIAGYVIEKLLSLGIEVTTTVRRIARTDETEYLDECNCFVCDIRDEAAIYSAVQTVDGVIHLAGLLGTSENISQAKLTNDVNVNGTLSILNAVNNFKIPCVIIGVGNHFENNTYSISKTAAERYALMYQHNFDTPIAVVRAFNAYGPRQKWGKIKKIVPTFINQALRNQTITVYGGVDNCGTMDLIYVVDVARMLVETLERVASGIKFPNPIEVGSGIGLRVWDIANDIIERIGRGDIVEVPMRAGEHERSVVVAMNSCYTDMAGWKYGLDNTIFYYKRHMEIER